MPGADPVRRTGRRTRDGEGGAGGGDVPGRYQVGDGAPPDPLIPGEVLFGEGDIELNAGRPVTTLTVTNTADRPVQVGSHYHFAEANPGLSFDRGAAWGQRLAVPAGAGGCVAPGRAPPGRPGSPGGR